jgi:hypothetical protein
MKIERVSMPNVNTSELFAAEIHLLGTDAGGRLGSLVSGEWRTVLGVNNSHWSARLTFEGSPAPGDFFQAEVKLLVSGARQYFSEGVEFTVWENGTKGMGRVLPTAARHFER